MDAERNLPDVHGSPQTSELLAAIPTKLEFPLHGRHTARLRVQNIGRQSCSMHARPPRSRCISLGGCKQAVRLAPGMHVHIDVSYDAALNPACHLDAEIMLKHEGGCIRIPITVSHLCARFELHGELNYGMVCAGTDVVKQLSLINSGGSGGSWALRTESDFKMEVRPSEGSLEAGGSIKVNVIIPHIDPGDWLGHLHLQSGAAEEPVHQHTVTVQAVKAAVELQGALGQPLNEIDFGTSLLNDTYKKTMLITNESPVAVKFAIHVVGAGSTSGQASSNCENQEIHDRISGFLDAARARAHARGRSDVPFQVLPCHGEVAPFQKASLTVTYAPTFQQRQNGFSARTAPECAIHSFVGKVELRGNSSRVCQVLLKGRCEFNVASVLPTQLHFFEGTSHTASFCVHNKAKDASIRYDIRNIPTFFRIATYQVQGTVQPQCIATVTVKYQPKALGQHSGDLILAVLAKNGKIAERHVISLIGLSGGVVAGRLDQNAVRGKVVPNGQPTQMAMLKLKTQGTDDSLSLGMDTWADLGTGDPGLPNTTKDVLWTVDRSVPPKFSPIPGSFKTKAALQPFKDWPETQEEEQIVSASLTTKQIQSILAGPSVLNFGTCSSGVATTKQFFVVNTLAQAVHVVLDAQSHDHLASSENCSQVIPAGRTAVYPITLICASSRSVYHDVDVVLNGFHFLPFTVQADILDPTVKLSHTDMDFTLLPQNWLNYCDKKVLMENSQAVPFSYEWSNPMPGVFNVAPMSGDIPPHSSSETLIRWIPPAESNPGLKQDCRLVLKVNGSFISVVHLRGHSPEAKLQCKPNAFDLGMICLGLPVKISTDLINEGQLCTAFRCVDLNPNTVCHPISSVLEAGESVTAEIGFTPDQVGATTTLIQLEQRGGPAVPISITADVRIPTDVHFSADELSFGTLYQGAMKKLPISLKNCESMPCEVDIDLTQEHLFKLSLGIDQWDATSNTDCPLQQWPACDPACSDQKPSQGHRYRVKLDSHTSLQLMVQFHALEIRDVSMILPATVYCGIACPPQQLRQTLLLSAECLESRLSASALELDFGACVVLPCKSTPPPPVEQSLMITNQQKRPMLWCFGELCCHNMGQCNNVFMVAQQEGVLKPHACCNVVVSFQPDQCIPYTASMELRARLADETAFLPILTLEFKGTGRSPAILFNTPYLVLPAVPLGVVSSAEFTVINDGYDNVDFSYRLPADEQHIPVQVAFPQGTVIGMAKSSVPAVVSFRADRPTSFSCSIEIVDENGTRYVLSVSGCTDCFSGSLQPFISCNSLKSQEIKGLYADPANHWTLPDVDTVLKISVPQLSSLACKYIQCKSGKTTDGDILFDIVSSKGKALVDIMEALSGNLVAGKVNSFSADHVQAATQVHAQCTAILAHLQRYGGLVNIVRPETLMDKETVLQYIRKKLPSTRDCQLWEELLEKQDWRSVNVHAWIYCLYQSIRVFTLRAINMDSFTSRARAYVEAAKVSALVPSSNILSQPECILIAWLQLHLERVLPHSKKRLFDLDQDLADGLGLCSVLLAHWPALTALQSQIIVEPAQQVDAENNIAIFVSMLSLLQCPLVVGMDDILPPRPCSLAFLVAYLYEWLPQLIPHEQLQFDGRLQTEEVQYLELSNPASKPLAYSLRIEGHHDFSVAASHLHIEPRSKAVLAIKCTPSCGSNRSAQLIMISHKDGAGNSKTLVFRLDSKVQTDIPLKVIKTEKPQYELKQFQISVSNPFPADCEFAISLESKVVVNQDSSARNKSVVGICGSPIGAGTKARIFPPAFGITKQMMRMAKGAEEKVQAVFLPFTPGLHTCFVWFVDLEQGCFCYELIGRALSPAVYSEHEFTVDIKATSIMVPIPAANQQIDNAKRLWLQHHPSSKNKELVSLVKARQHREVIGFEIEHVSSILQCPKHITVSDRAGGSDTLNELNGLQLELRPVGLGLYPDRIMLTNECESRVIDVVVNVKELEHTYTLGFCSQARKGVIQHIPLFNSSDKPASICANILLDGSIPSDVFTGPSEVTVPAGTAGAYPLSFLAPTCGVFKARLLLAALATKEKWVYFLEGEALDPPAVGHISSACQSGVRSTVNVSVPNHSKEDIIYSVFTDLPVVQGDSILTVSAGGTSSYTMSVLAPISGTYTGTLTFTNSNGNYEWFTMVLEALEPPKLACINVEAVVGAAKEIKVHASNPSTESVQLTACYDKTSGLCGPNLYHLAPLESRIIKFYFCPTTPGSSTARIQLICPVVGEFWYELALKGTAELCVGRPPDRRHGTLECTSGAGEHGATVLPLVKCALGQKTSLAVPLPAWIDPLTDCNFQCHPDTCFHVESKERQGTCSHILELEITYRPQALKAIDFAEVWVEHGASKCLIYCLQGACLPPTISQSQISAAIGGSSICQLQFQNPFPYQAYVNVTSRANSQWVMDLGNITDNMLLSKFELLDLSVVYKPTANGPIHSEAEVSIFCHCPETQEEAEFLYKISGAVDGKQTCTVGQTNGFLTPPGLKSDRVFSLMFPPGATPHGPCTGCMKDPYPTVDAAAALAAHHSKDKRGKSFPFRMQMIAKSPTPERLIVCRAPPGSSTLVPLHLSASEAENTEFVSYFTPESSPCFDVKPRKGKLQSLRRDVPTLEIEFKNTGKPGQTAMLIVQTNDCTRALAVHGKS